MITADRWMDGCLDFGWQCFFDDTWHYSEPRDEKTVRVK